MNTNKSKYIRIVNNNDYDPDVEKCIKTLEMQFKIDFRSLPQWQELIEKMYAVQTNFKNKVQNATNRKFDIIDKILLETYRVSPFELTSKLARTSNLWKAKKQNQKKRKISLQPEPSTVSVPDTIAINTSMNEEYEMKSNVHPNSEDSQLQIQSQVAKQDSDQDKLGTPPRLPPNICTNQHYILSPIGSKDIALSYKESELLDKNYKSETIKDNYFLPNEIKNVKCCPDKIIITENSRKEQCLKFSIANSFSELLHIRFHNVSDSSYFDTFRIKPELPVNLSPGLAQSYRIIFTFGGKVEDGNDVSLMLHFKIGYNVYIKSDSDTLCIPLISRFDRSNSIIVTETVNIPPTYSWKINMKCRFPRGGVQIQVDNRAYVLHIRKKILSFVNESESSSQSFTAVAPETDSLNQKISDEMEIQNVTLVSPKRTNTAEDIGTVQINTFDVVGLLLNDILDLVFDRFVFKNTYLRISPKSKRIVLVYFTKAEHIGFHQSYYDLIFYDPENYNEILIKTIKVFAEVLPHPIIIKPTILDMTNSPVTFGYCEDHFTITNTHKIYPVTVKINTTTKMNKIFKITPIETSIPANCIVKFNIKTCKRDRNESDKFNILTYFVIKILVIGDKSLYEHVPPFYYEIIAPCAKEYIKVYDKKQFNDLLQINDIENMMNE